jgi:hypothetical protein
MRIKVTFFFFSSSPTLPRETEEELGLSRDFVKILGTRNDVLSINDIAGILYVVLTLLSGQVTPLVGYIGEMEKIHFNPNKDEIEEVFTISLSDLSSNLTWKNDKPVFNGPHRVWGLTAYILHSFMRDTLKWTLNKPNNTTQ